MVYYNLIIGIGSLAVIPFLKKKKFPIPLERVDLWGSFVAAIFLFVATLLLTVSFKIADGVVIPNILVSTRGIFVVFISAVLTHRGSTLLETQTPKIYLLRFVASSLIIFFIWMTLSK